MRSGRLTLSKLAAFADSSTILFRSSRIDDAIEKFEVGTERVVMFAVVKFSNPLELELVESFRNRGGGFPKAMNMPRDSGVYSTLIKSKKPLQYPYHCTTVPGTYRRGGAGAERADSINNRVPG